MLLILALISSERHAEMTESRSSRDECSTRRTIVQGGSVAHKEVFKDREDKGIPLAWFRAHLNDWFDE